MGGLSSSVLHLAICLSKIYKENKHLILVQEDPNYENFEIDYILPDNLSGHWGISTRLRRPFCRAIYPAVLWHRYSFLHVRRAMGIRNQDQRGEGDGRLYPRRDPGALGVLHDQRRPRGCGAEPDVRFCGSTGP